MAMMLKGCSNVRNRICWQLFQSKPAYIIASIRLGVSYFAGPCFRGEEEINAFVVAAMTVHYVHRHQVPWPYFRSHFFSCFPNSGGRGKFVFLDVPGR